jgi:hypothetical protein
MADEWVRSSTCSANSCIEAQKSPGGRMVAIRDNLMPKMSIIVSAEAWRAFLEGAKNGDFDSLL